MDFIRPGGLSCHYWLTRTDLAEEARNHAGFATIAGPAGTDWTHSQDPGSQLGHN